MSAVFYLQPVKKFKVISDRGIGRIIIQSLGFENTIGTSAKPVTPSKSQCSQWLRQPLDLPSKDNELRLIVFQFLHVPFKYPKILLREKFRKNRYL